MGKLNIAFGLYFAITSFLTGKIYNADAKKLFEGDLILSEAQIEAASHGGIADSPAHMRKASKQYLWPGGVVPYSMETQLEEDALALEAITNGMRLWSSKTCITFKERKDQKAFIYFFIGGSCSSEVGRSGDKQYITLVSHCWNAGDVAHVVAHSLGFYHEQSRPDRDDFVTINWDNIVESIGQRKGPSVLDIKQMNLLYKCNGYGGDGGGGGGTGGGGDGGGGGGTGGGGGSGGGAGGENCKDLNKRCDYWARIGECNRNSGYMRIFCKKSCQLCYAQGNCSDRNQYCSYWAAQGYCHYNPAYMKSHCKRSCRVCG